MELAIVEQSDVVDLLLARLDVMTTELLRHARGDASWLARFVDLRVRLDLALHRRDGHAFAVPAVCRELGELLTSRDAASGEFSAYYARQRATSARLRALHDDAVAGCDALAACLRGALHRSVPANDHEAAHVGVSRRGAIAGER